MNQLVIFVSSLGLAAAVIWWFFGKPKSNVVSAQIGQSEQTVQITVSGGYTPNRIQLQKGLPAKLVFTRKDASTCFDEVVLPDFGIKTKLPVGKAFEVGIKPETAGNYKYSCGMNMFHGEIIVK